MPRRREERDRNDRRSGRREERDRDDRHDDDTDLDAIGDEAFLEELEEDLNLGSSRGIELAEATKVRDAELAEADAARDAELVEATKVRDAELVEADAARDAELVEAAKVRDAKMAKFVSETVAKAEAVVEVFLEERTPELER